jgi:glyoxylase-like metal-dependent hydrolase (beta-lactamase superfamily II)
MDGKWVELAEGVLVRRYTDFDLSVGLIIGAAGCLVVDTRADIAQGRELAAAVREITALPWQVVLTHAHFDHCFGTLAFLPADIWAEHRCNTALADTGALQRAYWADWYRRTGRSEDAARIAEVTPVLPDRLVHGSATVDLGGRTVTLLHPGAGHTDHDLVVHVPDAAVLFAGDLVEQGAPPSFDDAYPRIWPSTVDKLLALGAHTVVPGHGDPVDADFVAAQRDELAEVAVLAAAVARGELTDTEALARSPYPEDVTHTAIARISAGST